MILPIILLHKTAILTSMASLTETWFRDSDDSKLVDFDGYSAVNCNRKDRSGGGATLFIDNDIEFIEDLKIKCDDCDSIFIEFKRKEKALTRKIIFGIIHRPDYVELDTFYSDLARVFDATNNERKTCYIYSNNFSHALITRITEHSATLLDTAWQHNN